MKPKHTIPGGTLAWSLLAGIVLWAVVILAVAEVARASTTPVFTWAPVPITCTPMTGAPWWAWGVYHPNHTIEVRQYLCDAAAATLATGQVTEETGQFAGIVGHELAHSAGIVDEHQADCVGWLIYPSVAAKLGFTPAEVKAMRAAVQGAFASGCTA